MKHFHKSARDLPRRVAVICPAEERFDGTGGAIAQWVRAVYEYSKTEYRVFCPSVSASFAGKLDVYASSTSSDRLLAAALRWERAKRGFVTRAASSLLSRLRLSERIWLSTVARHLTNFDVLHIHNRPNYAAHFRSLGFSGEIILHMHNNLEDYVPENQSLKLLAVDRFVFCSQFLEQQAQARFRLKNTYVVHNGVYDTGQSNEPKVELALIFVGRLIPAKGALDAIAIYDLLRERGHPYSLSIYGGASDATGSTVYADEVKSAVLARQARDGLGAIALTSFAPHEEVLDSMSKSTFLIHPCRWEEPFGMVIVEAMSQGTPPVAYSRGGIPEIIDDGVDGYLVDPVRGLDGFVEVILGSLGQDYRRVASASIATSRRRFAWSRIAEDFYDHLLYKDVQNK